MKLEASGAARLEAKASYQRKRTTTEVIPPDVTRAKASAWLDLISPITEWAGLKGDQLRHKRDQLRLQQEATLTKIVSIAHAHLLESEQVIKPIPNKFVVPFLEKASLEDERSELCSRWANLLETAATDYDPSLIRFATVLSEIGAGEVAFLDTLVREPRGARPLSNIEDAPVVFLYGVLDRMICNLIAPQTTASKLLKCIVEEFEYPGSIWPFVGASKGDFDWELPHPSWSEKKEAIASNLVSVGVLHYIDGLEGEIGKYRWFGRVYALTSFGVRFVRACSREIRSELARHDAEFEKEMEALRMAAGQSGQKAK